MSNQPNGDRDRPRILLLIKGLGLGGAERLLTDALPYLDRTRFAYEFAYILPWKDHLVSQIEQAGFPVHCLAPQKASGVGRLQEIRLLSSVPEQLWRLQNERKFDLFHAHLAVPGILARIVGSFKRIPVVYTEHNMLENAHLFTRWVNSITYGLNDRVLAVSAEVDASIRRYGLHAKSQVDVLLNGVAVENVKQEATRSAGLRKELNIPPDHLVVGTVAVFRRQKRLHDWLKVASQIASEREDVTFLLAGDGPEAPLLHAQRQALGLCERVRMPGFRPDGRAILNLLDVYLMTSDYEGLPIALLEAMALGKPVVATGVGGIPEAVEHEREGFLAAVGAVDELAHYTTQLLGDRQLRQQMGQFAERTVMERFSLKDRVAFTEKLYLEVWQQTRSRSATTAPPR